MSTPHHDAYFEFSFIFPNIVCVFSLFSLIPFTVLMASSTFSKLFHKAKMELVSYSDALFNIHGIAQLNQEVDYYSARTKTVWTARLALLKTKQKSAVEKRRIASARSASVHRLSCLPWGKQLALLILPSLFLDFGEKHQDETVDIFTSRKFHFSIWCLCNRFFLNSHLLLIFSSGVFAF